MGQRNWAWFAAAGIAVMLWACDDEIVDLGLSKDAATERAPEASTDAPPSGGDAGVTPDASDQDASTVDASDDGSTGDATSEERTAEAEAGDAPRPIDASPSDGATDGGGPGDEGDGSPGD